MTAPHTRLVVDPSGDGQRLDVYLAETTDLSRRGARRLITNGGVERNGQVLRVQSRILTVGDVIRVLLPNSELGVPPAPDMAEISILHRDDSLLIANKPAGTLSQPSEASTGNEEAFDHIVLKYLALEAGNRPFLRMVHRLDRMTSGAVLFAVDPDALRPLTRAWADGIVDRSYLAVVEGSPEFEEIVIDRPITRDRTHRWRFTCHPDGKNAQTRVAVAQRLDSGLTVVQCELMTGRTHQVRVHLAEVGFPVLGDRLYGSRRASVAPRPLLHAASIALPHPATGEAIHVSCPIPDDMAKFGVTPAMAKEKGKEA